MYVNSYVFQVVLNEYSSNTAALLSADSRKCTGDVFTNTTCASEYRVVSVQENKGRGEIADLIGHMQPVVGESGHVAQETRERQHCELVDGAREQHADHQRVHDERLRTRHALRTARRDLT